MPDPIQETVSSPDSTPDKAADSVAGAPVREAGNPAPDLSVARAAERERRRLERRRLLASGPPSPCVSVCQMDPMTGYCVGCLRTIDEIRDWIISTPNERQKILDLLPGRKERSGL